MSQARARKIKLILFDVDGVLTDGSIWLLPGPGGEMLEAKGFNAHDGIGVSLARLGGIKTGVITKRKSDAVALRVRDLSMDIVCQGADDKLSALQGILKEQNLTAAQVAFVGDDVVDLAAMKASGLAVAVPNADPRVKAAAHYVTRRGGGHGAGRDAIEYVLRAQGKLEQVLRDYVKGKR